jgi:hypothetical protein
MGNVTAEQFAQAKENVIKLTKGELGVERLLLTDKIRLVS